MAKTFNNFLTDSIKAFGEITGGYLTLVDLGTEKNYRAMLISCTFDTDVVIRFSANPDMPELIIPGGNFNISMDRFRHDGLIEIKAVAGNPTVGQLKMVNWRAE